MPVTNQNIIVAWHPLAMIIKVVVFVFGQFSLIVAIIRKRFIIPHPKRKGIPNRHSSLLIKTTIHIMKYVSLNNYFSKTSVIYKFITHKNTFKNSKQFSHYLKITVVHFLVHL